MSGSPHVEIERSWTTNAAAWTTVVRDGLIPSRKAGTDAAIVEAVRALRTGPILDVGCGEGWLVRALAEHGLAATGIDISAPLIHAARALGGGTFDVVTYEQLQQQPEIVAGPWRGIVCNFALLAEPVHPLLTALRTRLAAGGRLLIQTVHPWSARGDRPYQSEWRTETFDAFGTAFPAPMPWYYRTMGDWHRALTTAGLRVLRLDEPLHPDTGAPLSALFTCEAW
jgi:SAM-dependent methyltransferase